MRVVLITGATRGIGAAIAEMMNEADTKLILTCTLAEDAERLNGKNYANKQYLSVNFLDADALERFALLVEGLDRLDVCVNNAGINIINPMEKITIEDFNKLHSINYYAPFRICQAAATVMRRQKCGRIVNVASVWSVVTKSGRSLYSGAKTGMVGMTRTMAVELAPDNVLVNCISPGFTLTDMTCQSLTPDAIETMRSRIPMSRMAEPVEIAKTVKFLCSEDNTYITGQNLIVDGGYSIV